MFELTMLTMDGKKHVEEISRISLPTNDGIRTILENHMSAVIPIEIGEVRLIKDKESEVVVVSEGIFNFKANKGHLFTRTFEFADEIDVARAERARARAEDRLAEKHSSAELLETEIALKRALTRISASKKH